MAMRISRIGFKFALLLGGAAVVPLLAYGFISILSLQSGTRDSIIIGNQNVATRAAEEIRRWVATNADLLKALGANLQDTDLQPSQQEQIVRNYVLTFREFREITMYDEAGGVLASSRVGAPYVGIPKGSPLQIAPGVTMSPMRIDQDMLPTSVFAIHLTRLNQPAGWLVGEFSLEEMWRMVDRIRIGEHGFALVVAPNGALIAHGDPAKKALVARAHNMQDHRLVQLLVSTSRDTPVSDEYQDDGRRQLGVATRIALLGWTVIVEQPTSEAFANATQLQRQLVVAISVALLGMIGVGYFFGRQFLTPIHALQRGTHAIAAGELTTRVNIRTGDEFADLGDAFNMMADRLVELQENVKRQERQAMFGRLAAGLVHDLSHPIQNLGNSTRLLVRDDIDEESRRAIRATIERELETLKRFMEDLRHVVKPRPVERFALDVNTSVAEIVEAMRAEGERVGVTLDARYADEPLVINGDRFALGRVYRNLITNAIQATDQGGRVVVTTKRSGDDVEINVSDTGIGIAPERLAAIFEDFVTTKRHGLGLGLAISKRIVEQLDGAITVESELGRGTAFTIRFPARDDRSEHAAAS
jgi:signal transduction histidine kinase